MKTKISRICIIGLLTACILMTGAVFANTIITYNVFNSIGATTGNIAKISFDEAGNSGSGAFVFGDTTELGYFNLAMSGQNDRTVICYEQLKGYYINPFRGLYRVWPLDQSTLNYLNSEEIEYFSGLTMTGGLFTNCIAEGISNRYAVFGYLEYDYEYNYEGEYHLETGYKVRAGISGLNTENPTFVEALILTGGGDGFNLSASGLIVDSMLGLGKVYPYEDGNYANIKPLLGSGHISCNRSPLDFNEIYTGGTATFTLSCTGSSAITGTITNSDISTSGYNNGIVNVHHYSSLDDITVDFTAGSQTGDIQLILNESTLHLSHDTGVSNTNTISNILKINSIDIPDTGDAPTITITKQPSNEWSGSKIIKASSSNYSGFEYIITGSSICSSATNFSDSESYNGSDIILSSELYSGKYVCFRAWNSYGTGYAKSNIITKIDTTGPICTRGQPSPILLQVGNTGSITLNCTDSGAGIDESSVSSNSFYSNFHLTINNISKQGSATNKSFTISYSANNIGNGSISLTGNGVKDIVGNGSSNVTYSNIVITGADTPGSNNPTCERLVMIPDQPLGDWEQNVLFSIELYCGSTGRFCLSDTNSVSECLDRIPISPNPYSDTITTHDHNGKYICAFAQTGLQTESICSDYPIMIDDINPDIELTSPDNGESFEIGSNLTVRWSGHDSQSGISGYNLKVQSPTYLYSFDYNSNITSKSLFLDKSGTWYWSVTGYDNVGNGVADSGYFYVIDAGNNNSGGNNTGSNNTGSNNTGNNNTGGNNTGNNNSGNNLYSGFYLIHPALFEQISLGENITFDWNGGNVNSGYNWAVQKAGGVIVASGFTMGTEVVVNSGHFTTGAYSRFVKDIATNTIKDIPLFYVVENGFYPDLKANEFEFDEVKNAYINEYYKSNSIIIDGLDDDWYTFAYLKDGIGALFINGDFVGTGGIVKNGDRIRIELKSSNEYNTTISATLIVGLGNNIVSGDFKVTTKGGINGWDDPALSPLQRLWGAIFVDSLVEMYQNDPEKLATFLATFMQLLQDKSDYYASKIQEAENTGDNELINEYKTYKSAVDFLYTIVKYRYDNLNVEDRTVYIAPNGKQYLVEYDEHRMAYTSPDFARPKYFPTWELFTNHIDMNNPAVGKWGIVGNVITTHNGKVYTIYETNGKWTSSNFKTAKYFDTKEDIINHILANNPASNWNHTVDPDFEPVVYTAPNGKVYKIFKTSSKGNNPNMYSSYNFVDAKYFTSLEAAKKFINQNNKK